jgi:hypothetical protein
MCEKCGFSGCKHDEARREQAKEDRLDAVIFDMMCENENPPGREALQKWIDQFPQFERELRGFVKGWRLMEQEQGNPVTDEEVNEVESAFQLERKYPGKFVWGKPRKCDVCGSRGAALCFDGVRRCLGCINRAFPEGVNNV